MIFQSIRWRLQLWYGLAFLVLLAAFGATAYQLERNRQLRLLDAEFQTRLAALSRPPPRPPLDPGGPMRGRGGRRAEGFPDDGPPEDRSFPPAQRGPFRLPAIPAALFGSDTNSFYYIIWASDGAILAHSDAAPAGVPLPADAAQRGPPPPPRMRGLYRELYHATPGGEVVLVGRSIAADLAGLRWVAWSLAGAGGVVLLLALAGGWWIATRAIRPIEDISATAVKIAAGDLSQRINAADTDSELGRLAAVLNSTFARLESAFSQQRQFTSDAAHELRTPLSVLLTQTQTALNRDRTAPEYRATLEACGRAARRMRKLIESLLALARLDAGVETMNPSPFDLSKMVNDCVELVAPLAEPRRVKIHSTVPPLPCLADPERLGQVILNLLTNAIEYNREAGEVRISARRQNDAVILEVTDTGPGIAPEDLPRLFERFYRADKSRSGGDHAGLGLAISRAIVEAHGGTLEVSSPPGQATTFKLTLPFAASETTSPTSPAQL